MGQEILSGIIGVAIGLTVGGFITIQLIKEMVREGYDFTVDEDGKPTWEKR